MGRTRSSGPRLCAERSEDLEPGDKSAPTGGRWGECGPVDHMLRTDRAGRRDLELGFKVFSAQKERVKSYDLTLSFRAEDGT